LKCTIEKKKIIIALKTESDIHFETIFFAKTTLGMSMGTHGYG